MLIVRNQQQEAFDHPVAKGVECSLLTHATRLFARQVRDIGEPAARAMIHKGVVASAQYGIVEEYEVSRYVDLMFLLGEDFDTDGCLAWAGQALGDGTLSAQEKMDRLCEQARRHLGQAGPDQAG